MRQQTFEFRTWGGKREGAGREPDGDKPGVSHLKRPEFPARHPVHVTMRLLAGVGYLRGYSRMRAIENALREAEERFGVRIVHYSIQGNHLHLIVEAESAEALGRAMQGLAVRLARTLNRLARRGGKVFADRYHSHVLATLREVINAVRYVLENFRHHVRENLSSDPCAGALVPPKTWLLQHAGVPSG